MGIGCPSKARRCVESGRIIGFGRYYRKWIQRYQCATCGKHFSQATNKSEFGQNKRQINTKVLKLLCSGVSQRRIAYLLKIHQITVARKLAFLGLQARLINHRRRKFRSTVFEVQFDDLETIEHTKMKPF